jgi:hypothetical protein
MSFLIWYSSWWKNTKILDLLNKVEKIQMKCDKPTILPNSKENDTLQ